MGDHSRTKSKSRSARFLMGRGLVLLSMKFSGGADPTYLPATTIIPTLEMLSARDVFQASGSFNTPPDYHPDTGMNIYRLV